VGFAHRLRPHCCEEVSGIRCLFPGQAGKEILDVMRRVANSFPHERFYVTTFLAGIVS
jgi:hypothetical protein